MCISIFKCREKWSAVSGFEVCPGGDLHLLCFDFPLVVMADDGVSQLKTRLGSSSVNLPLTHQLPEASDEATTSSGTRR